MGDCGDVIPSLWPTAILPRILSEATRSTLEIISAALGVSINAEAIDPAIYTATARGTSA